MDGEKHKEFDRSYFDAAELDTRRKGKRDDEQSAKKEVGLKPVPYFRLFRFLTPKDKVWLAIAVISALIASACFPLLNILFGEMAELMVNAKRVNIDCANNASTISPNTPSPAIDSEKLLERMAEFSIYTAIVGVIELITGYLFISIFSRLAEIQMFRLRKEYLRALLRQNIGWYDTVQDRNFVAKISENVTKVQEAIADKAAMCMFYCLSTLIFLVSALWYGWLLTLVILSTSPVIAISTVIVTSLQSKLTAQEQKAYSKAGMVAQEALSNIKTVMAFSGQQKERDRYEAGLVFALRAGRMRGIVSAFGNGFLWFLNYASYSLVFWYGTKLIFDGRREACTKTPEYDTAAFMVVFFNVLTGSYHFGNALSYLEVFSVGRGAAASIFNVLDRNPEIDSYADAGISPSKRPKGKIVFNNVRFSYPSRKDVKVLRGINLELLPGTTVALVGSSGCGKSTCLQLLQRFYDPDEGSIFVDDLNIKDLKLNWYRDQLGVVSQEPVLFNTTIAENVRLPQKYDTMVGERGAQLSGGQKQRIAIARALIRNPSILLLDEATSALDTQSEAVVQEALDRASEGRTTLIVAHRLSTVRNADVIVSIHNGQVTEVGSHSSLMANKGLYYQLITSQMSGETPDDTTNNYTKSSEKRMSLEPSEDQEFPESMAQPPAEEDLEEHLAKRTSFFSLLRLSSKEWHWMAIGLVFSILQGGMLPLYAYFYGEFMGVLSINDAEEAQREANVYATYFLGIGIYAGVTIGIGLSCFSIAGEALTNRLRKLSFGTMLIQDLSWYDNPRNNVGGLCTRLSGDAASVQGATGTRLGMVSQAFTTIAISAGLALYGLPKLGAVAIAFVPFILIAGFYNGKMLENQQIEEKFATESASSYAFQAVSSIRTVASLGKEEAFVEMYSQALLQPHKKAVAYSHLLGFVYGFSQALLYFAYATVFYYGAYLISEEDAEYTNVFIVGEALIWSMLMVGQTLAFAPNYNKAKVAGGRILNLLDTKPVIQSTPGTGLHTRNSEGSVIFDKVEFSYPERKATKVLKGLTLGIEPNTHVGICGPSGSGKSTCIQLMLRYYDTTSGNVIFDHRDIKTLNLDAFRSQVAIVSQEPALFDRSLADNIAYGDNTRNVTIDEIMDAARAANIHSFITSLPSGYLTRVGDMGAQLSGGQKQRVAIARALVRKPKLLLLDEATSALDAEKAR
ncbi:unnamed protein product [Allacma fusca]|uniref:Uncharacterized protein n=1 Tax=Allacma fusca TaxID=39272 RepID=A0A8J2LI19_9HEXA|nr:unnamed protein product [Allacma fusca]